MGLTVGEYLGALRAALRPSPWQQGRRSAVWLGWQMERELPPRAPGGAGDRPPVGRPACHLAGRGESLMAYRQHPEAPHATTDRSTLPTRGSTADAAYLQGRHEAVVREAAAFLDGEGSS